MVKARIKARDQGLGMFQGSWSHLLGEQLLIIVKIPRKQEERLLQNQVLYLP